MGGRKVYLASGDLQYKVKLEQAKLAAENGESLGHLSHNVLGSLYAFIVLIALITVYWSSFLKNLTFIFNI